MSNKQIIAVIGGGAAGFFSALKAKLDSPNSQVLIFEKTSKFLAKVKISGGGRCNVTNATFDNQQLSKNYPRGENHLRKAFSQFDASDTVEWFESRGVLLKTYPDNCIFPQANSSQVIIDCFLNEAQKLGVELRLNTGIRTISKSENGFDLTLDSDVLHADKVIITTGGQPKISGLKWIEDLGVSIVPPVPSLFTFNMPGSSICELMGNVVERATVKIQGTKLVASGPLLITHWGMSGPAILKLSAWGARILAAKSYTFTIFVNWLDSIKESDLRVELEKLKIRNGDKMLQNANPFPITLKLWHFLLQKHGISLQVRWKDINPKLINKLTTLLLYDEYSVSGKTTFKEEFVTAGGVSLSEIDFKTMECKSVEGLFFAGEVLDIDGITGGFNFQAAWTTGFIAGKNAAIEGHSD